MRTSLSFVKTLIVVLTVVGCSTIAVADDDIVQKHLASACKDNDAGCLKEWWTEYRGALLDEFHFWSAFRSDAVNQNRNAAEEDLRLAQLKHQYRHHSWDFYRGYEIQGVDNDRLMAVTWGCRDAVISMKFWLIGLGHVDYRQGAADKAAFDKAAKQCMTADEGSAKAAYRYHRKS